MKTKNYAWVLNLTGWAALGLAVVDSVIFNIGLANGHPFDPVIAFGIMLTALIGVVTSVVARSLKKIEARLTKIENERSGSNGVSK
ncbi:MAG: hypothetical protein ACHQRJ_08060 [Alphaproteobacteria bacterium]